MKYIFYIKLLKNYKLVHIRNQQLNGDYNKYQICYKMHVFWYAARSWYCNWEENIIPQTYLKNKTYVFHRHHRPVFQSRNMCNAKDIPTRIDIS